jgi:vacuolar-type H+-ATPase subunit H
VFPNPDQKSRGTASRSGANNATVYDEGGIMDAEKSLLTEIRSIEDECSRKLEEAKKQSEGATSSAKREAAQIIDGADSKGAEAAQQYYDTELLKIRADSEKIRKIGALEREEAIARGEKKLDDALQKIMTVVASE